MKFANLIMKLLHRFYRKDDFVKSFLDVVQTLFDKISAVIIRLLNILHFNRLDEAGCAFWENLLKIKGIAESIDERQANIRARWRGKGPKNNAFI